MTSIAQRCRVLLYSVDPPGLNAFEVFDPESFSTIPAINDSLIIIESDGSIGPGLATSWKRLSPTTWELELRSGVEFHDGTPFNADDVAATFRAHREPTPSALGGGILSTIKDVRRTSSHRVVIETQMPDALFLRRLHWSVIYSRRILENGGRHAVSAEPNGTGAYRLERWDRGTEIVLRRNPKHWANKAAIDEIVLPIVRQKEWYDRLVHGRADIAWNLDSVDAVRLRKHSDIYVESAPAAISQWFLLANRGPLKNDSVRRALNLAIYRPMLVSIAEHGMGAPQTSVGTPEQVGFAPDLLPYAYDPEKARALLSEAGLDELTLKGVVCETSTTLFLAVREFLARVGVHLDGEVVPRSEVISQIVGPHLRGEGRYQGDFAVLPVDNPVVDSLFHQFIFLFSRGPFSLMEDPEFDQHFLSSASDTNDSTEARQALERYSADRALLLYTVRQYAHYAGRNGFRTELPVSGHFNYTSFLNLHQVDEARTVVRKTTIPPCEGLEVEDVKNLVEGTGHLGTFYLPRGTDFCTPQVKRVWQNILASEARWWVQTHPLMEELVHQSEARMHLTNVLGSTHRIGIIGVRDDGRELFRNEGYNRLIHPTSQGSPLSIFDVPANPGWKEVTASVQESGSWAGVVILPKQLESASTRFHLTVTRATDSGGLAIGYTLVFSDFSGEEERIRSKAIRTILDHVPYGLFRIDAEGCVLDGYSDACDKFFTRSGEAIRGERLDVLLGLGERAGQHLLVCIQQVFEDTLPEEVAIGQIPQYVQQSGREFKLTAAVIREGKNAITSILFTIEDVTPLVAARKDAEFAHSLLNILHFRTWFTSYVRGFSSDLRTTMATLDTAEGQRSGRGLLHTAKGVLSQFGLREYALKIHSIEESEQLRPEHYQLLNQLLEKFLSDNHAVLRISLEDDDPEYPVRKSTLDGLLATIMKEASLEELRTKAEKLITAMESLSVGGFLGPVRDAVAQQAERRGKKIRLEVEGENLSVSTNLLPLFGVLPHLTRNAVDHGIELPSDRAGKGEIGTIRIQVRLDEDVTHVVVEDDGAGIDTERLLARAIERGQVSAEAAARMPEDERLALVFCPGLSSIDSVTETSGRGVGASAVHAVVSELGGRIAVTSQRGLGSCFRIEIPKRYGS